MPIRPGTVSPGLARRQATTGAALPAGPIPSPGVPPAAITAVRVRPAAAAAPTAGPAVPAAAALTAGPAVPAAAAALTAGPAVPAAAAAHTAGPAVPAAALTAQEAAAAALTAQEAAAAAQEAAAVPVVVPGLLLPVQDVKLSFIAGIGSRIPAFSRFKIILL